MGKLLVSLQVYDDCGHHYDRSGGLVIHDLVTNTKYDLDIGLLSYETYWNDYTELAENWTPYLDDNTGDDEVNISVMDVEYNMEEGQKDQSSISYEEVMADTTHMSVIFYKGSTYFVLIMDQNYYDYFTGLKVKFCGSEHVG